MAAPAFVGAAAAAYDGTTAWPTSLPISASTPSGVQDGDRVLCVVTTFADSNITPTVPTPTNWTFVNSNVANPIGQHLGVWMFSARWGADTKDQLVAPTSTVTAGRSWRLQCMAWRPSKPFNQSAMAFTTGNLSLASPPIGNSYGAPDGATIVEVQITRNGEFTGALSGFYGNLTPTLRVDQASVPLRGGALRMVDASISQNISSNTGTWSRTYTGSTVSTVFLGAIEAAEFDPTPGGWSVGRIEY
jgi:hypothetical protein